MVNMLWWTVANMVNYGEHGGHSKLWQTWWAWWIMVNYGEHGEHGKHGKLWWTWWTQLPFTTEWQFHFKYCQKTTQECPRYPFMSWTCVRFSVFICETQRRQHWLRLNARGTFNCVCLSYLKPHLIPMDPPHEDTAAQRYKKKWY
jgi:hypothetical protein